MMGKLKYFKVFVIKLKSLTIVIVIFLIYVKKNNQISLIFVTITKRIPKKLKYYYVKNFNSSCLYL